MNNTLFNDEPQGITLSEFNRRIASAVNTNPMVQSQWVVAETSDVKTRGGHCYLELIEKDPNTGKTLAKIGAVAWADTYLRIDAKLHAATGSRFESDMKVLVRISANFHPQYGLKAVISDINPAFTLGEAERHRREILARLKSEGILDMNKTQPWARPTQRIAIVSAVGAAGLGDFINQLDTNLSGLKFYHHLFTATMQGENTSRTVCAALEQINAHAEYFDCVVIIRGGGSTTDLAWFDDYDIAAYVAQFPLPVIVGIGHEQDVTILDYVAKQRVKTPTAAAEFLIGMAETELAFLEQCRADIRLSVGDALTQGREQLSRYSIAISQQAQARLRKERERITGAAAAIPVVISSKLQSERTRFDTTVERIKNAVQRVLADCNTRLKHIGETTRLLSPQNTLDRGYSITTVGGKHITDAAQLHAGDVITTRFKQGETTSTVN